MRPFHSLFFLLCIGLGLLALGELFPQPIRIGDLELRFFRFSGALTVSPTESTQVVNQKKLLNLQEKTEQLVREDTGIFSNEDFAGDLEEDSARGFMPEVAFHIDSTSGIQYPAGDSTILHPFLRSLDSARLAETPVRILHIGDSQIEGDRISGYLRQRLQQQYGGCGPGLVPFAEEAPTRTYLRIETQAETEKFVLYGKPHPGPHNQYSLFHNYHRLKPDTAQNQENLQEKFLYRLNGQGYRRNSVFELARLLCRNRGGELELVSSGSDNRSRKFSESDSLRIISWPQPGTVRQWGFRVKTTGTTDFLGVCLDCRHGVAVDNIPLRGSSGLEILRIQPRFLQEQIRRLNVGLIILQFGINVVPYESPRYDWYENSLVRIIQTLKRSRPGLQVLVVGVSDMARKKEGTWGSFETIPLVLEAQRRACARTNSAFWDLFQVMGGKNSILAWARTEPPLAGKDYIHLTPKGAQVIGEFLFQALDHQKKREKDLIHNQAQAINP